MHTFFARAILAGWLAVGLVMFGGTAWADGGRGLHKKIYAVPVPSGVEGPSAKPVKIDGKLDDWDLSGQLRMYVMQETSDMQSARFAMMYDKDALYLSGVVRDPTPMMNRHDPNVDPQRAWDADVCQIFFSLDPKLPYPIEATNFTQPEAPIGTLYLWYFTDRQEPNLAAFRGMKFTDALRPELGKNGAIPRDKFQATYVKAEDGRGYTFEYRIPWTTLGMANIPKANDILSAVVCLFWGRPDGLKTAGGAAWCYDVMSGPGFPWHGTYCYGKIIFAAKGNLPKELVEEGLPLERDLPLTFKYTAPEDSQVTVQLFNDQNYVVRTLVAQGDRLAGKAVERWDGLDDSGNILPAGTYRWKGLYHQPITTKFLFAAHNSGQPPYSTDDNKGGWGGDHGTPTTACALPDGMLLAWNVCELGWGVIRTDLTGKKQWGSKHCAQVLATDGKRFFGAGGGGFEAHAGVMVYDAGDSRPLNFGNGKPITDLPEGGDAASNAVTGLACAGGKLYTALAGRNLVAVNDAEQGTLKDIIPVEKPGSLAVAGDGTLLVVSGGKVLQVKGKAVALFTEQNLDQPAGIAVDAEGKVYVSNRGKLQNVSVFSPDGKYLKSIGKTGGRPAVGRYAKDGMLEPGGIAVDAKGNLWVAETLDSPKRFSVWNQADGALTNDFFGAAGYFGWIWMDLRKPDEVYCNNTIWKVDWTKNTCYPYSTIWRATKPNMIGSVAADGYAGHLRVMTAKNGKQFAWGQVDYSGTLYMRDGDVFKPIAGSIRIAFGQYGSGLLYPVMKEFHEKNKAGAYLWQDKNNDQTIQVEELMVSPAGRGELTFNWIDPGLNVWCDAGWIYKPARFEADGRPVYDFSKSNSIPFKGGNANATSLYLDDKDDTVYTLNPGAKPGFARWTRDGKLLWGYPDIRPWNLALNLPLVTPGKLYGLTMPLCIAGEFTGAATYFNPYHIFTRDGVYVAMLTHDGRDGKGLGPDVIATESIQGQIVKPDGMNRYFLLAGAHEGRVMEILGLDTVKPLPGGEYVHTADHVKQASVAQDEYLQALRKGQRLEIVRGRKALASATAVGKSLDATRGFTAKAAYDEKNLYVLYDVTSPAPLVNAQSDTKIIFKGGNLLDLQIATDPAADAKRVKPALGDVRLLVTRQADPSAGSPQSGSGQAKPVAVIYRPKVKDFKGEPTVLSSPTGKESFDAIAVSDRIALEYKPKNGGFAAVVTIPLEVLGWTPKPGASVKIDFGYVFGNIAGTQAAVRSYWWNNGYDANIQNDIPSESRLTPAKWGTATVE